MATKQYFPFTYEGRVFKKGPPFIQRVAAEILADKMLIKSTPFTKGQWMRLSRESHDLAEPRKLVTMIIGVVNYHLGFPHPPNAKIRLSARALPAKRPEKGSPEAEEIIQDIIKRMEASFGGKKNIPTTVKQWRQDDHLSYAKARAAGLSLEVMRHVHGPGWQRRGSRKASKGERVKHFCKVVNKLKTPEGGRVQTMQEWRKAHASSQRVATLEGIQWEVARILLFRDIPPDK